jgi:hypothetical protein
MKELRDNFFKLFIVTVLVGSLYLNYMFAIGIPKTQARNHYNLALKLLEYGETDKAIDELNTAQNYWDEDYIREALQNINKPE